MGHRIIEEVIEEIIGLKTIAEKEVGVGLEKCPTWVALEETTEVTVIVGWGQVWE